MAWAAPQLLHESSQILLRLFSVLCLIKHFNIWLLNQCCIHWLFVVFFFFFSFLDDYFTSSTIASNSPDNKSFFYFGPRCFQIHGEQRNLCIRADLKSTLPEEARNSETSLVCTEFYRCFRMRRRRSESRWNQRCLGGSPLSQEYLHLLQQTKACFNIVRYCAHFCSICSCVQNSLSELYVQKATSF